MDYFKRKLSQLLQSRTAILYLLAVWEVVVIYAYAAGKSPRPSGLPMMFAAPGIMSFVLFSQYGSPKNWWVPFYGTTITINEMKKINSGDEAQQLADGMADWIKEMNIKPVYQVNAFRYTFFRAKHATMFKLAWG